MGQQPLSLNGFESSDNTDVLPEGYHMTELGPLPKEWQVVRLGDVADIGPTRIERHSRDVFPFIPMSLIPEQGLFISQWEYKTPEEIRSGVVIAEGDLLLAKITPCLENGKQGIVRGIPGGWGYATTEVFPIRPGNQLLIEFLALYLLQPHVRQNLAAKMEGTTGRRRLPKSVLLALPIPLPPLPEQRAIAYVLRAVQQAKEATEQVIQATRELKKSLMRHLFTYGPVPADAADRVELQETEIGSIPSHWQVVRFEEAIIPQRIRVGKLKQSEYMPYGKYPIIDQGQKYIAGYTNREDLLYQGRLPVIIFGDHTRIWKFIDFPFVCGAEGTKIIIPNTKIFDPKFLFFALSRLNIPSRGYNRHYALLREKKIPLPPLPEQQEIARILQAVDEKIRAEEARKEALEALFKSLLHNLMTAKIRLPADFIAQLSEQANHEGE